MTSDYRDELALARDLAVRAGEILQRHFGTGFDVHMKGWADPVTIADRESEALIRSEISHRYPDDGLDGEEEGLKAGRSGRTWLIDPLDGTADFSGGLPIYAVVITLVDAVNIARPLLNVTYDPVRGELFHAVHGRGAFRNDAPVQVGTTPDFASALVHLHFSNTPRVWEQSLELARRITAVAPHARNLGSTAIAQAYVACGRLDGHVKISSGKYDVVGGNLLIEEAGGKVTDLNGQSWRYPGSLLAASASAFPLILTQTGGLVAETG